MKEKATERSLKERCGREIHKNSGKEIYKTRRRCQQEYRKAKKEYV
jgi:hypothetical protein